MADSHRGRPRDSKRHNAVIDATVELLIDRGYDGLTLTEVASRAQVGRPLIYQWWGSKQALVQEALFRRQPHRPPKLPNDAPFAAVLASLITEMVELHSRPEFRVGLPGLIADMVSDPQLQAVTEEQFIAPIRTRYTELFEHAKETGEVRREVNSEAMLDTLRGAVMFHTLVRPSTDPDALIRHLTGTILHGVHTS